MIYTIAGIIILSIAIAGCVLLCVSEPPPGYRDPPDPGATDEDEHAVISRLDGPRRDPP